MNFKNFKVFAGTLLWSAVMGALVMHRLSLVALAVIVSVTPMVPRSRSYFDL